MEIVVNKSFMDRVEDFLQSSAAMFLCLVMVLVFSTRNNVAVLVRMNREEDGDLSLDDVRLIALSFAIVIELIILVLASRGLSKAGKNYALCSFALHLIYYHRWDKLIMKDNWLDPKVADTMVTNFVTSLLVSGMISGSIYYFSEQIRLAIEEKKKKQKITDLHQQIRILEETITKLNQARTEIEDSITALHQKITRAEEAFLIKNREYEKLNRTITQREADLRETEEIIASCTEKITSIKRAKARLGTGIVTPEIKEMIDQIDV